MEINPAAPARAERDIDIAAPIEVVWDVLSNVQDWPRWHDEVKSTAITGPVGPGAEFRWKPDRGTIKSRIERAEPPHHLAWTGRTFGISAIHVWRLERDEEGTRVKTEESLKVCLHGCCAGRRRRASTNLWTGGFATSRRNPSAVPRRRKIKSLETFAGRPGNGSQAKTSRDARPNPVLVVAVLFSWNLSSTVESCPGKR